MIIYTDCKSFRFKPTVTRSIPAAGNRKDVEMAVPLKHLRNFWRTIEMPLLNCETSLQLTWSENSVINNSTGVRTFEITDTKLYVPAVILWTPVSKKLLELLKSRFKRTISWNKYD